ncbi:MAG: branched-chain amino acid ABC transporter permease [Deltaproteobacteria bacterium]|jgi:branched-chain amino acid transport system permease protein|nr:branched-chain amino acid ABC transporter permease [Deltaproteobacteria bacterium]
MTFDAVIRSARIRNSRLLSFFGPAALLFALFPLFGPSNYTIHLLIMVMMYTVLAGAWNILGGYTGQFSVGHASFFGIAGYTMGIMTHHGISGPVPGAVLGIALACALACVIGVCTMRLRGIFFALTTLSLAEILRKLALYRDDLTGGPLGLSVVISGMSKVEYYYIIFAMMCLMFTALWLFERSRFGLLCMAVRENDDAALSMGVNTAAVKVRATVVSAFFTAVAGAFYAAYIGVLEPDAVFSANLSIKIIILAILGGSGSLIGPLLGVLIVVVPEELINAYFGGQFAGISGIAYGIILIVTILLKPSGVRSFLAFAIPHKRD